MTFTTTSTTTAGAGGSACSGAGAGSGASACSGASAGAGSVEKYLAEFGSSTNTMYSVSALTTGISGLQTTPHSTLH